MIVQGAMRGALPTEQAVPTAGRHRRKVGLLLGSLIAPLASCLHLCGVGGDTAIPMRQSLLGVAAGPHSQA